MVAALIFEIMVEVTAITLLSTLAWRRQWLLRAIPMRRRLADAWQTHFRFAKGDDESSFLRVVATLFWSSQQPTLLEDLQCKEIMSTDRLFSV